MRLLGRQFVYLVFVVGAIISWLFKGRKKQAPQSNDAVELPDDPATLRQALRHADWHIRLDAVHKLADLRDTSTLPDLANGLLDADSEVREAVVTALLPFGNDAILPVSNVLRTGGLEARESAAVTLGRLADKRAIPALADALANDESAWVRIAAVKSLATIGGQKAATAIRSALDDPHEDVAAAARKALHRA